MSLSLKANFQPLRLDKSKLLEIEQKVIVSILQSNFFIFKLMVLNRLKK